MKFTPGLVVYTLVQADRVDDLEEWIRSVLLPASDEQGLTEQWWMARTDQQRDGAAVVLLFFEGDDIMKFDVEAILRPKYGAERARAEADTFAAMLAGDQEVWRLTPAP
jgi:hypothetical protein